MRRDCVTQVIVRWRDGEEDNFATPFEAENYINWALDELGEPEAAWLEDMQGRKKWDYRLVEDEEGRVNSAPRNIKPNSGVDIISTPLTPVAMIFQDLFVSWRLIMSPK